MIEYSREIGLYYIIVFIIVSIVSRIARLLFLENRVYCNYYYLSIKFLLEEPLRFHCFLSKYCLVINFNHFERRTSRHEYRYLRMKLNRQRIEHIPPSCSAIPPRLSQRVADSLITMLKSQGRSCLLKRHQPTFTVRAPRRRILVPSAGAITERCSRP